MLENLKPHTSDEFIGLSEETRISSQTCPNKKALTEDKYLKNSKHLVLEAAKEIKPEENKREINRKESVAKDIQWLNEANTVHHGELNCFERFNTSYEGEIKSGVPHGHGIYRFDGGLSYYEGEFEFGKYNGYGVLHKHSGAHYVGSWSQNSRSNFGKQIYKNGDIYEGNWKENNYDGYGTLDYKKGSYYYGNWVKGEKSGYGVFKWLDGVVYSGEWSSNRKRKGVIYYQNGCRLKWDSTSSEDDWFFNIKFFDANGTCFKGIREDIYNKYLKSIDWHFKVAPDYWKKDIKKIYMEEMKTKYQIAEEKKKIEIEEVKKSIEIEEEKKRIKIEEEKERIAIAESRKKHSFINEDESPKVEWYKIFECFRRKNKKFD